MKRQLDGLDTTSDLYKTYAAQLKVLEDYQTSLNQNAVSGMQQAMAMLSQLDDAAYTLRKQAKNVSGQLALGAQTMLITIKNLLHQGKPAGNAHTAGSQSGCAENSAKTRQ